MRASCNRESESTPIAARRSTVSAWSGSLGTASTSGNMERSQSVAPTPQAVPIETPSMALHLSIDA